MLFIFACFQYTNNLPYHIMHSQCNNSFHNQFMRFKHIYNNPITLVNVGYFTLTIRFTISGGFRLMNPPLLSFGNVLIHLTILSPIMADAVWCIPTRGITYSVLPSCRMLFGASRHVVSLIRFSHHDRCRLVHPDTWYHLFGSPIMTDAV